MTKNGASLLTRRREDSISDDCSGEPGGVDFSKDVKDAKVGCSVGLKVIAKEHQVRKDQTDTPSRLRTNLDGLTIMPFEMQQVNPIPSVRRIPKLRKQVKTRR
jgi:hypothetical protein